MTTYFKPGDFPPFDFGELKKHENKLSDIFINYKDSDVLNKHLKVLKSTDFHAGYSIGFGFEPIMMKRLGLPMLKWMIYLPEPMFSAATR